MRSVVYLAEVRSCHRVGVNELLHALGEADAALNAANLLEVAHGNPQYPVAAVASLGGLEGPRRCHCEGIGRRSIRACARTFPQAIR